MAAGSNEDDEDEEFQESDPVSTEVTVAPLQTARRRKTTFSKTTENKTQDNSFQLKEIKEEPNCDNEAIEARNYSDNDFDNLESEANSNWS